MVQTCVTKIARQFPLYCVDFARLYSCQAEDFCAHFRISSEKILRWVDTADQKTSCLTSS